ncbi:MAG TPA: hypothetical protein VFP29_12475 [Methyloceanibacter sp.]|nr:hypothetical protein [Methyloceanibacter sp.]
MVPCPDDLPPLRGSALDGSATSGDIVLWRRVDMQQFWNDCRRRHSDLVDFVARKLGGGWLPAPSAAPPAAPPAAAPARAP